MSVNQRGAIPILELDFGFSSRWGINGGTPPTTGNKNWTALAKIGIDNSWNCTSLHPASADGVIVLASCVSVCVLVCVCLALTGERTDIQT